MKSWETFLEQKIDPDKIKEHILFWYERLAPKKNGMVAIWELREHIEATFPSIAREEFDNILRSLRGEGFRLSPTSRLRPKGTTWREAEQQLANSIQGMGNEILFWLEKI